MAPLIDIAGVSKSYGAQAVLRAADLTVAAREFVALIGASGAGKTTLLKTINRLTVPDAGTVRIAGEAVDAGDPAALRRRIGYVFQGIGLFPHMTVGENIAVTPRLLGWDRKAVAARVRELLDLVALPQDLAARFPDALSGGQQQRVGVARALAARPAIMLMDEPFGALDPVTRDALGTAYRALHTQLGLTTLMITHDVQEAVLFADRIVVLEGGRVAAAGTPAALMARSDPAIRALMDMPARRAARVAALLGRTPSGDGGATNG